MSSVSSTSHRFSLRRSALIVSAGLLAGVLTLGGAVAAEAAPVGPPIPPIPFPFPFPIPGPLPTVTSSASTATANGQVTLTVINFQPNDTVTVTFDSAPLTTSAATGFTQGLADATGHYVATAYLPSSATVGAHTITVTGAATGARETPITIVAAPTGTVTPSTVALSAYLSKGVTVTFSGFTPGASVSFGMGDQGSGGPVGSPVVAGPSGTATLTFVPTVGAAYSTAGTYTFSAFSGNGSIVAQAVTLTVTADPTVAAPAPAAPIATPAAPVQQTASFTG